MDKLMVCGGCNAKIGAGDLSGLLESLPIVQREDHLVGFQGHDDGAVIRISDTEAIITTMDFFPPMVEDPYLFGAIAATNALSDIYAMGGEPISAMNMVCFPEEEDFSLLEEILRGGAEVVAASGAALSGGHSIHDSKIKYGLSVVGKVNIHGLWRNNTPQEGDVLILTKPLGISLLMTGISVDEVSQSDYRRALQSMTTSNGPAARILKSYSPHAVTDVTGFGLAGHLGEMMGKNFTALLDTKKLPILPGALEAAEAMVFTAGGQRNRRHMEGKIGGHTSPAMEEILFDPQTSGGLLISLPPDRGEAFLQALHQEGIDGRIIGEVLASAGLPIILKGGRR